MTLEEQLVRALKSLSPVHMQVEAMTVKSVDEDSLTCVVTPLDDGAEIQDVRLKAAIDGVKDGIVQIPAVNSSVLVARIGNTTENRFVVAFSSVDKVVINGGSNGGLINIQTLVDNLNKSNELLAAIKMSFDSWTPAPGDGGSALKLLYDTNAAGKTTGDFSDMEDDKVLH